jgi:hypothetical protein
LLFENKMIIYFLFILFYYKCLLVVYTRINTIFCYDPIVMSKLFGIKVIFICHLNILSWLNININLFYPIVHVGNTNSIDLFIEIMRYIEIWIKGIYELDNFKTTWKSSNIYHFRKQVFFKFLFNIFCYLICKY